MWVDERREGFSSGDGNLRLSLPGLADFTGRKKQCSPDQVSDPAGLEDSKGSFNYHAAVVLLPTEKQYAYCRFWWGLFENEVSASPSPCLSGKNELIPETDIPIS